MASITLSPDPQRFPDGVTITAYKTSNWSGTGIDTTPNGSAPQGSSDASGTIASRAVTLTGLAVDQDYYGVYNAGGGDYRYFRFGTWQSSNTVRSKDAVLRARSPINVLDYGALGDGVNDDQAAIQAAVEAAKAFGGTRGQTVLLPPGVYLISAAITLYDGITLEGASPEWKDTTKGTVIKTTGTGVLAGAAMVNVNNTLWAAVRRIAFVGPTSDPTANTTMGISDFSDTAHQAGFLTVEECSFRYLGGTAIALYGNCVRIRYNRGDDNNSHFIHVKDSTVLGNGSDSFIEFNDSGAAWNNGGAGSGANGDALRIEGGANNTIVGNELYNHKIGIHIMAGRGNGVYNNRCEKHDQNGISLDTATVDNAINNNRCFNNGWISGKRGITLAGASLRNQVNNNTIRNDSTTGGPTNTQDGILVSGASNFNQFIGNRIFAMQEYGITIASSTNNVFRNNLIDSPQKDGIHAASGVTDNTFADNDFAAVGLATNITYHCIFVDADSDRNLIVDNKGRTAGAANQAATGVRINSADCNTNVVRGNDFQSGPATAVTDNGTGTITS